MRVPNAGRLVAEAGRRRQARGAPGPPKLFAASWSRDPVMGTSGSRRSRSTPWWPTRSSEAAHRLGSLWMTQSPPGRRCLRGCARMHPRGTRRTADRRASRADIGIGAGGAATASPVFHDLLGLAETSCPVTPSASPYVGRVIREAVSEYADEVRDGEFPATRRHEDGPAALSKCAESSATAAPRRRGKVAPQK